MRRIGSIVVVVMAAGCAAPAAQRTDLGGGNTVLTKRGSYGGPASGGLRMQVEQQALAECAAQGRALSVIDVRGVDPDPPAFPSATLQYRCVPI